jgi:Holliday junction resolvasome RuvABC endonuclease subunit
VWDSLPSQAAQPEVLLECLLSPSGEAQEVPEVQGHFHPQTELQNLLHPVVLSKQTQMNSLWVGIDPGQSGGISFVSGIYKTEAIKMPATERDLWKVFEAINPIGCFIVIERVHSMPRQGVASSFKFGMSYGALRMAIVATGIPFEDVTPQKWMKALGCLTGGDKNVSKQRAQSLFPKLKVTHALADSLLIAEYARRTYQ